MAEKHLRITGVYSETSTGVATGDSTIPLCIDDPVGSPDGASTYATWTRGAGLDSMVVLSFEAFAESHRSITKVNAHGIMHWTFASTAWNVGFKGKIADSFDTIASGASGTAPITYTDETKEYLVNPTGGAGWTQAGLATPQLYTYANRASGNSIIDITSVYATVTYLLKGGGGGWRRTVGCLLPFLGAGLGAEHVPGMAQLLWQAKGLILTPAEWAQFLEALRNGAC